MIAWPQPFYSLKHKITIEAKIGFVTASYTYAFHAMILTLHPWDTVNPHRQRTKLLSLPQAASRQHDHLLADTSLRILLCARHPQRRRHILDSSVSQMHHSVNIHWIPCAYFILLTAGGRPEQQQEVFPEYRSYQEIEFMAS